MTSARNAVIAFGRQTAEGSALATPKYEIPMGAGLVSPDRATSELPWTSDSQESIGDFVQRNSGIIEATLPILPVSCVPIIQGVMGARTTTPGTPNSHVMTFADVLPWTSWFYRQPGDNFHKLADAKLATCEWRWAAGSPLEMSVGGMGKALTRAATKWGAASLVEGVNPFFTYIGATMKMDPSATPAVTTVKNIGRGSISVGRNLDARQTDGMGFQYILEQKRETQISLDEVVFENNDLINTILFGSPTGTSQVTAIVEGSAEFTFVGSDGVAAATRSIVFSFPRVQWAVDRVPGANPDGSTVVYTVTGKVHKPASGSSMQVTVLNGDAGTNY